MKAIVQDVYDSADVLHLSDIDRPEPGEREVLVRVRAAGVDPGVWHEMTGEPYLIRAFGYGLRRPRKPVRGWDVAGTVEAVGARVTRFRPGDEVFGAGVGGFAEFAVVPGNKLAAKPANATFAEAAVVPASGVTALQAVRDKGRVKAGQRVLVIGAGGGVGTFAVQIAKGLGAHVTGVCSTAKIDHVRSIGVDRIIDYTGEEITGSFDVIVDTAGNRPLAALRRVLEPAGTLVIVGGENAGGRWIGMGRQVKAALLSPVVKQRLVMLLAVARSADLEHLRELIEAGTVKPVIDRAFPLAEAADAVRYLQHGRTRGGKVVLTV